MFLWEVDPKRTSAGELAFSRNTMRTASDLNEGRGVTSDDGPQPATMARNQRR
jgi:hypothetical protein